jgi:bleomycin hydrolase
MHLVGKATDEEGHGYFIIKNSWGPIGPFEGYLYMSEEYFLMKTVGLTVHREGVPERILNKIK